LDARGGEALYPTYTGRGAGWPDYGSNAQAHFRAWLERRYGDIQALNGAWGVYLGSFSGATAPKDRSNPARFADWIDYRFTAMAERMAWHYAAVRAADSSRPICTCNHGTFFRGDAYIALGADMSQYADTADGFEMGQIMEGDDPTCYNLWYASALAGLGKIGAAARLAYKWPDPKARGGSTSYTPEAARRYSIEALGSGWWHLGLIQWSGDLPDGEWGVRGTPAEAEIAKIFADIKKVRPLAEGAWPILPRIGLYLSHTQWIHKGWDPAWTEFHVWAIQRQLDHAILWEQQLRNGEAEPYPVVISINNGILDSESIDALQRYVDRGGHLIVLGDLGEQTEFLLANPRVHRPWESDIKTANDARKALDKLAEVLDEIEVGPFCRLSAQSLVTRDQEFELGNKQHDMPPTLGPKNTIGQSFCAPAERIRSIAFNCPTYTNRPTGFNVTLRLRRGGPTGAILAESTHPATGIADNSWVPLDMDVTVSPGETLFAEIAPDREIPDDVLGVWAESTGAYPDGTAYVNGQPQPWDCKLRVKTSRRVPSPQAIEAFVLSDGANYLVPLLNLAREDAAVGFALDPALVPNTSDYTLMDALTGRKLAAGPTADVTVPARGYRILWVQSNVSPENRWGPRESWSNGSGLTAKGVRLSDFRSFCAARATDALDRGRPEKALAYLNKREATPTVRVQKCEQDTLGNIEIVVTCTLPAHAEPFEGAVGVARVVPLPDVAAPFVETEPGVYRTTIPATDIVAYNYELREYVPYRGPLQVIGNLWRKRTLAQFDRRLR